MSDNDKAPDLAREHRISILIQRVGRLLEGKPTDIVGLVIGQLAASYFCSIAKNAKDAHQGVDALNSGIRRVIDKHFADKPKPH